MRLSVIIPTFNEAAHIRDTLEPLQPMRARGHEVILVDAGSMDDTLGRAAPLVDRCLTTRRGRARQMNAGAAHARGEILWFLHADTRVAPACDRIILAACGDTTSWGRFDIRLSGRQRLLRLVERLMNLRSRLSGIATGDQGMFVSRRLFEGVGGFPEIPLMEDIELSKRLRRTVRPLCLRKRILTSSRRWETQGIVRTIGRMWMLRLAYAAGVSAEHLAPHYD
jgi:rSAM/selenodomain-associated transferase 2